MAVTAGAAKQQAAAGGAAAVAEGTKVKPRAA
jgi:hypothetical protein